MDYSTKNITELKTLCKQMGIRGVDKYRKDDKDKLIALLNTTTVPQNVIESSSSVIQEPLKFIDLFCGIGGFHQALNAVVPNATCVLASDIDARAQTTYETNHKVKPVGDIKKIDIPKIPSFQLLCGGFPCQAFSIAQWKDKKAFDDPRGTLFFEILKVIDHHKPKCILLENVANITKINKGLVFNTILNALTSRGYHVSYNLLSPHQFGIPQNRERVYIVAVLGEKKFEFKSLANKSSSVVLGDILDSDVPENHFIEADKYVILDQKHIKKQAKSGLMFCGYLKGELRKKGARENTEHLSRVHRQLMRIYSSKGTHPTLAASETSGRYHIYDEVKKRVRRLTLNECYTLMAYPASFKKHESKGVAYKQIGNSVCVKVVEEIMRELLKQGFL